MIHGARHKLNTMKSSDKSDYHHALPSTESWMTSHMISRWSGPPSCNSEADETRDQVVLPYHPMYQLALENRIAIGGYYSLYKYNIAIFPYIGPII
jgi:hypothetical protein